MKNIVTVFLVLLLSATSLNAGNYNKSYKNEHRAKKYEQYAENYIKQAEKFEQKAENCSKESKKQYYLKKANNYKLKAEQKLKMAEAYRTNNSKLLSDASKKYNELKQSPATYNKKEEKISYKSKDKKEDIARLEEKIKQLQNELDKMKTNQ